MNSADIIGECFHIGTHHATALSICWLSSLHLDYSITNPLSFVIPSNNKSKSKQNAFDAPRANSYNGMSLGISLAVGRLTLDQLGQVRILDPQPVWRIRLGV